jgi:hypothetical protein
VADKSNEQGELRNWGTFEIKKEKKKREKRETKAFHALGMVPCTFSVTSLARAAADHLQLTTR